MTDVVIGGQTYSVQIDDIKQSGYTGGVNNFSDINGLPKYEVTATVNGQTFTKTVTFAGHHIIPTSVTKNNPASKAFLDAIGFDITNFAQNGVGLPNFAAGASATDAELALSVQFGASHTGGHSKYNNQIKAAIDTLAAQYQSLVRDGASTEAFLQSAKKTVNGMVVQIRTDLTDPVNTEYTEFCALRGGNIFRQTVA